MAFAVHLLRDVDPASLAHLRARLHQDVTLTTGSDLPEPSDYQVLVAGRPKQEHLTASTDLQTLIIPFAGLPQETRRLMLGFPAIAVHNLHHNAVAAAEMAIALLLTAGKFIVPSDQALRRHDWRPRYRPSPAIVLQGKTALVLGYGAIGHRVARACRGLGMDVMATRRRFPAGTEEQVYPPEALPSLLPEADALIITLPLTAETEGLIGEKGLSLLPPWSVLVNVGRGRIVDEGALYRALREGTLLAAGLDVWYQYPRDAASRSDTPPSAYPFHTLENVVMSPHRAGAGGAKEIELRRMDHLARLLNAAAAGKEIPNRVDVAAGY